MIITQIIPPSPALASYVHHYWILKTNGEPMSSLIMPMGSMKWMFHRKKPFIVNGQANDQLTASVCGQYDTSIRVYSEDEMEMLCVFFQPYASKLIMGMPCQQFMGENVDFDDLEYNEFKELKQKVQNSTDNDTAIQIIESFITQQLKKTEGSVYIRPLTFALEKIIQDPSLKVDKLAEASCLSERQFRRVFNENYGLTPKQMLRIQRLKVATKDIGESNGMNFDEIIYNLGFTDHSHFNKEFQNMTGMSPTEYAHYLQTIKEQKIMSAFKSYHSDKT